MGHCKDCKWWQAGTYQSEPHTCDHPKAVQGYAGSKEPPVDGVHIENDEGWGWYVGPEFGCVNFEAKEYP